MWTKHLTLYLRPGFCVYKCYPWYQHQADCNCIQIGTNTCISESGMDGAVTSPMYVAAQLRLPLTPIILARSKIFQCNCLVV
jgi:hypothetical protein